MMRCVAGLMCGRVVVTFLAVGVLALVTTGCRPSSDSDAVEVDRLPISKASAVGQSADPMAREFNRLFHDGQVYFAGLPTETGLKMAATRGVTTVINILSEPESTTRVSFDERALVEELGMEYVFIPVTPGSFSVADVDRFAQAMDAASLGDPGGGKVLFHCASSNRVGGMWAAYLARERGFETEEALELGRAAGLSRESMVDATKRVIGQ